MARKGNLKKRVVDAIPDDKGRGKASETNNVHGERFLNGNGPSGPLMESVEKDKSDHISDGKNRKQKREKSMKKDMQGKDGMRDLDQPVSCENNSRDGTVNSCTEEASSLREDNGALPSSDHSLDFEKSGSGCVQNGFETEDKIKNIEFSARTVVRCLKESAMPILKAGSEWMERQKPLLVSLRVNVSLYCDYARTKMELAYPIVLGWLVQLGNIALLLSMIWLDCILRGIDSLLSMGTTALLSTLCCSILSMIAMIGMTKFLVILAIASLLGIFVGFILSLLVIAFSGMAFLWVYGSFWTTSLFILLGVLSYASSRERLALFITTVYSAYCAWTYIGWTGLLLGLNLSFISSDALIYFLRNNISENRRTNRPSEDTAGMQGQQGFSHGDPLNGSASDTGFKSSSDRGPGVPSTSGTDSDISSEEEVVRLLNCCDHYSALGFSRYGDIDVSVLKREYRKKAMLVHPDKNMGNEKAAEAFKKLQNAYEILLDSIKRKAYDDELRREELLNYFHRFQNDSPKNGRNGFFTAGFSRPGTESEDLFAQARRIACKKCGDFHVWFQTKKSKSQARWCQECNDFHAAKDGDGWVEQCSQPFLFGLLQKVDAPCAFVCADSRIFDATEWYICQGMRCPANSHKPSFHVNTSVTSKHGSKGSTSGNRGGGGMPSNMEGKMTEEEFYEWLQNAVQAGIFDDVSNATAAESPSARPGNIPKTSGGSNSGSSNKKKKKGKKQW